MSVIHIKKLRLKWIVINVTENSKIMMTSDIQNECVDFVKNLGMKSPIEMYVYREDGQFSYHHSYNP